MINRYIVLVFCGLLSLQLLAQTPYLELNSPVENLIRHYETTSGSFSNMLHTTVRPYSNGKLAAWMTEYSSLITDKSKTDHFNHNLMHSSLIPWADTQYYDSRRPVARHFYRSKTHFYQIHEKDFDLMINPGFLVQVGTPNPDQYPVITNIRAISVQGSIGRKLGFYYFISENQLFPSQHELEYRIKWGSYPGAHLTKTFKTNGVDFFLARGYITFNPIPAINIQFGQDRNFIGYGIRSLLLSDFATDYPFLKINTQIWKLQYTNLYARLTDRYGYVIGNKSIKPLPAKYMALHYLSLNLLSNLNVGLFEAVNFHDNHGDGRGFELSYLNPIIFYRSVEHQLGDPDKMTAGLTAAWLPKKNIRLYSQLMINEFRLKDLRARNGSSGNKYGYQIGTDFTNLFGISNLDLKAEYNRIRPYSYTHYTVGSDDTYPVNSYSHYNQPLAHPVGANLSEWLVTLKTQPLPQLTASLNFIHTNYGADTADSNWGNNIFLNYRNIEQELGNTVGQGVATQINMFQALISYQLRYNLFIELDIRYRQLRSELPEQNSNLHLTALNIRYNLPYLPWMF